MLPSSEIPINAITLIYRLDKIQSKLANYLLYKLNITYLKMSPEEKLSFLNIYSLEIKDLYPIHAFHKAVNFSNELT